MAEYFRIGKFAGAHGLKGELLLRHELGAKTSLKGLHTIFIEQKKNSFIPWFVEGARMKNGNEVFVKLEGVSTREAALSLAQKEVWFTEADMKKFSATSSFIRLLGYTVISDSNPIGEVLEIIEQAHQALCRTIFHEREVLIPLNENTLQKIDHRQKQVIVKLPEGLLEVYLD